VNTPPDKQFFDRLITFLIWASIIGLVLMLGHWEESIQPINH
jgi:hypothetical protein